MSARASIKTADLNRAVKVALAHGCVVEVHGDRMLILPKPANEALPSATDEDAEAQWDRDLGLQ
ncbi:hypothetical protein [Phenylobacterium immobile]|uniref:hypothetical protein n=1 Tax=Phenylobacterium immobile TaxID=21 RepID=UPI000AFFEAB5|nr:hypothetical protein [Phenylobacterium immobile]